MMASKEFILCVGLLVVVSVCVVRGTTENIGEDEEVLSMNHGQHHHHHHGHRHHHHHHHHGGGKKDIKGIPMLSMDVLHGEGVHSLEHMYEKDEHVHVDEPTLASVDDTFTFLEVTGSHHVHPNATRTLVLLRASCLDARHRVRTCVDGDFGTNGCNHARKSRTFHCLRYKQLKLHVYNRYMCHKASHAATAALHAYDKHAKVCQHDSAEKESKCVMKLARERYDTAKHAQKRCSLYVKNGPKTAFVPLTWYKASAFTYREKKMKCEKLKRNPTELAQCRAELHKLRKQFIAHHAHDEQSWSWNQRWVFTLSWRHWNCGRLHKLHQRAKAKKCNAHYAKLLEKFRHSSKKRIAHKVIVYKLATEKAMKVLAEARLSHAANVKVAQMRMLEHHKYLNATGRSFPTLKGKFLLHSRLTERESHLWRLAHRKVRQMERMLEKLKVERARFELSHHDDHHHHFHFHDGHAHANGTSSSSSNSSTSTGTTAPSGTPAPTTNNATTKAVFKIVNDGGSKTSLKDVVELRKLVQGINVFSK